MLDNQGSAIGVYGYRGKGLVTPPSGASWENEFHRVGLFGQYARGPFNLNAAMTQGREQITASGTETDNRSYLIEGDYNVNDKIAVFGRYDYFDPNSDLAGDHNEGPVVGATCRFFELGRIVFEYHKQGKPPVAGTSKPWEYRFELAFMF